MLRIREYTKEDAVGCAAVINASVERMGGLNEAAREFIREKNTPEILHDELKVAFTLVAENDQQIVGVGSLAGNEIKRLYVTPEAQGEGVGKALMDAFEKEARLLGEEMLIIDSSPTAESFYASSGFTRVGEECFTRGEARFDCIRMQKILLDT